jgi:hypothetical protein
MIATPARIVRVNYIKLSSPLNASRCVQGGRRREKRGGGIEG